MRCTWIRRFSSQRELQHFVSLLRVSQACELGGTPATKHPPQRNIEGGDVRRSPVGRKLSIRTRTKHLSLVCLRTPSPRRRLACAVNCELTIIREMSNAGDRAVPGTRPDHRRPPTPYSATAPPCSSKNQMVKISVLSVRGAAQRGENLSKSAGARLPAQLEPAKADDARASFTARARGARRDSKSTAYEKE